MNRIAYKYGIYELRFGCSDEAAYIYNRIIDLYLERRNGVGWRERFLKELF